MSLRRNQWQAAHIEVCLREWMRLGWKAPVPELLPVDD